MEWEEVVPGRGTQLLVRQETCLVRRIHWAFEKEREHGKKSWAEGKEDCTAGHSER